MSNLDLQEGLVLRLEELSISFGGLKAVDNLSFEIKEKEIFGLIGPNGAGKTTAFNCITQFYRPNHGKIFFRDKHGKVSNLIDHPVHEIIKLGLVRTFQNVELIRELSILDNVLIGAHIDFKSSLLAQALKTKKAKDEETKLRDEAIEVLTFLGIADRMLLPAGGQPYGILKKVELARTLMCHPKLIILDEPAAGLNDIETVNLAKVIRTIRDKYGCAVLLVEHDMRLVMDVCDKICAINFGKFLAVGSPKEIQRNKDVQAAYLGETEEDQ
ncbi:MAG: ABC transporter ATP-binding protein [Firmicutes bacterium GWF2_51_9]|nr:ABC transporter ATP-binding protein [Erysipelotrichaceae bacterium]OGS53841.1 MAG: ABC transporter ATP-binding protein [Firmicutes bacterium GWF2_51_9]OGS57896.1 MAG: ABC transporter ATP-binding protein [Firmicutes bacterium GWE2_51_13]HAM62442.1 ABC transporter ATP-binding protein [Erysipelotrichaceae bacterium]HBZ41969.1 ABC transporter ATP-binding protein [Erysipelotrichaceae bacterium]